MKTKIFTILFFFVSYSYLNAQIVFTNTEFDFGQIYVNTGNVTKNIYFENKGSEKAWFGSCELKTPGSDYYFECCWGETNCKIKVPKYAILPGSKGSIEIFIQTNNIGKYDNYVILYHTYSKESIKLKYSYEIAINKEEAEAKAYETAIKGSLDDCYNYLNKYPSGLHFNDINNEIINREKKLYEKAENGNISDCDNYLNKYPTGTYYKEIIILKEEKVIYEKAKNGNTTDCDAYILAYPNGRYINVVKTLKTEKQNAIVKSNTIKINSNVALWKLGNKICCDKSGGIICGTINQWNEDKSHVQIKIITSPGGNLEGEKLTKNNLIWVPTTGKGWHLCLDDEIQKSISEDNSEEKQPPVIISSPSNSNQCSKCAGKGQYLCDYHDTDGDGYCTTCKNLGYVKCYRCNGTGKIY